jgi:Na+/H+ antiporter NhaD/arsenite permease-like protein
MYTLIILAFVMGYAAIAFEHPLRVNKTATALLTGVICWVFYIVGTSDKNLVSNQLYHHFGQISAILFFILSAMTIVEIIDGHDGFEVINNKIRTKDKRKLLWIIGLLTFFLSAVLDNLTTTIVMVSLLRKLIKDRKLRLSYVGIVIIAANAGGAWSPVGDVTTTMLWIGGQITSTNIMAQLFLPSLACLAVPMIIFSFRMKGSLEKVDDTQKPAETKLSGEQKLIFFLGLGVLILVPIFKTVTHLPPFMGILFGLAILWIVTEIIHKRKDEDAKNVFSVTQALEKVDVPSVLFFLGILVAIAALESTGQLELLANYLENTIGNVNIIVIVIGLLSAVIDNVPLVAATMGMYDLQAFPTDHYFWEFMAYCAGTGGSCLIIGSAAGVAAMGMERIDFIWYLKKISWLALIGYFAGALVYLTQEFIIR